MLRKLLAKIVYIGFVESGIAGELEAGKMNAEAINSKILEIYALEKRIASLVKKLEAEQIHK